jgi:hypothetical protein
MFTGAGTVPYIIAKGLHHRWAEYRVLHGDYAPDVFFYFWTIK